MSASINSATIQRALRLLLSNRCYRSWIVRNTAWVVRNTKYRDLYLTYLSVRYKHYERWLKWKWMCLMQKYIYMKLLLMCRKQKGASLSIITGRWSLKEWVWYIIVHRLTRKDVAGIHITGRWCRRDDVGFRIECVWIREVHAWSLEGDTGCQIEYIWCMNKVREWN